MRSRSHTLVLSCLLYCTAMLPAQLAEAPPQQPGAAAQLRETKRPAQPVTRPIPLGTVIVQRSPDGTAGGTGDAYKAGVEADGSFWFVPFFGSDAERTWPLALRDLRIACGESAVALGEPELQQREHTLVLARGLVEEQYEFRAGGVEQRFVFERLPAQAVGGGELTISLAVATDLVAGVDDHGLTLACERGHVGYSRAVAFDGAGHRCAVPTTVAGGRIELRVPAAFLAVARGPVTVDPVLATFQVQGQSAPTDLWMFPDVACGPLNGNSLYVYEHQYTVNDHDIWSVLCSPQGTPDPSTGTWIDYTSSYWEWPRAAYLADSQQFLVVARRSGSGTPRIWGRTRAAQGTTMGAQFQISPNLGTYATYDVAVGGDPNPSPSTPSRWCVAWIQEDTPPTERIDYMMVNAAGVVASGLTTIMPATTLASFDLSRGNGNTHEANQQWNLAVEAIDSTGDSDVYYARIARSGAVSKPATALVLSAERDSVPSCSSATAEDVWMISFERLMPPIDTDIMGQVMVGDAPASPIVNLSSLQIYLNYWLQRAPHVETDGARFSVAFQEYFNSTTGDADVRVSSFHLLPGTGGYQYGLGLTESRQILAFTNDIEDQMRASSFWNSNWSPSGAVLSPGMLAVWQRNRSIEGGWYEGRGNGGWVNIPTGCGTTLQAAGAPLLGAELTLTLQNPTPLGMIFLGAPLPSPVPVCGSCQLGIAPATAVGVVGSTLVVSVPAATGLFGSQVGFQGLRLVPGSCLADLQFSNTMIATIQ